MKWFKENILNKNALTKKLLGASAAAASAPSSSTSSNTKPSSNSTKPSSNTTNSNAKKSSTKHKSGASAKSRAVVPASHIATPGKAAQPPRGVHLGTLWVIACGFEHAIFLVREHCEASSALNPRP